MLEGFLKFFVFTACIGIASYYLGLFGFNVNYHWITIAIFIIGYLLYYLYEVKMK